MLKTGALAAGAVVLIAVVYVFTRDPAPAVVDVVGPEISTQPPPTVSAEKTMQVTDFLIRIEAGEVRGKEMNRLWSILRGSGMSKEALTALVTNAKARPNDPDAQYGVGIGAVSALVSGEISKDDLSQLPLLADAAFDKALALDDHHFGARYGKAISYRFWPETLGKGPAAIAEFETLREQGAQNASLPMLEGVYTNLGIQYRKAGDLEKAREALEEGLRVFPESREIKVQLKALGD